MRYTPAWRRRTWFLLLLLVAAAPAAYVPITRIIATFRLLAVVRHVAAGDSGEHLAIREENVARRLGRLDLEAIVYHPAGPLPTSAVILIPGVSELGCRHPSLVALARNLAGDGFLVLTPDIKMFREFRIYPPPLDEISFWLQEVRTLKGGENLRRVGLGGISFSGTLALIAASEPQNRDSVSYVLAIGAFDDLSRCSRFWFDAGPVTVGPGYYPTRAYAKWIIMLAALDSLPAAEDRKYLQAVLQNLLLQKDVPPPSSTLTDEGRRWYHLALLREDQEDPQLAQRIENRIAAMLYPELATARPAAEIRCPVFLAHGAYDDLIPPEESRRLRDKIVHATSYLLISPFLTHTHPSQTPLGWRRRAAAAFDLFAFFYHLIGVL